MASSPFTIMQGQIVTQTSPASIYSVGGNNLTPFYLRLPQFPLGQDWVYPFTKNFMYTLEFPLNGVIIDSTQTPPGYPAAPIGATSVIAQLVAHDTPQPFEAGTLQPQTIQKNALIDSVIAAAGTLHVIAAVPNQTVTVYSLSVVAASAASVTARFQSSGSGVGLTVIATGAPASTFIAQPLTSWQFGFALPLGEGLDLVNLSGAQGIEVHGSVSYTQA